MMDYYLITNRRHRVAHIAGPRNKPLCDPGTARTFAATLLGRGMRVCQTCATAELRSR